MKEITRAEIEKRLAILRESCMDDTGYVLDAKSVVPPVYFFQDKELVEMPEIPEIRDDYDPHKMSDHFGRPGGKFVGPITYGREVTVRSLLSAFNRQIGMDIKFKSKSYRRELFVFLKAKDETEWHEIKTGDRIITHELLILDYRLNIVLNFLTQPVLTYANIYSDFHGWGKLIKTKVDSVLQEVFGFTIVYDIAEVQKNIEKLFPLIYRWDDIPYALELLAAEKKNKFTLDEYRSFMQKLDIDTNGIVQLLKQGKVFTSDNYKSELASSVKNGIYCVVYRRLPWKMLALEIGDISTHEENGCLWKSLDDCFEEKILHELEEIERIKTPWLREHYSKEKHEFEFIVIEVNDDVRRKELCEYMTAAIKGKSEKDGRIFTKADFELIKQGLVKE